MHKADELPELPRKEWALFSLEVEASGMSVSSKGYPREVNVEEVLKQVIARGYPMTAMASRLEGGCQVCLAEIGKR